MIDAKPNLVTAADLTDLEQEAEGLPQVPMTREYVEAHDVVQRYVNNELDEKELDAFEMLFLGDQELLDAIDTEHALKNAMKMAASRLEPAKERRSASGWLAWFSHPMVAVASVAGLACALSAVVYLQTQLTTLRSTAPLHAQYLGPEIWLENARSSDGGQELPSVVLGKPSILKVEIPPRVGDVTITIDQPDGSTLALSATRAASDDAASVLFNPILAGDYTVRVESAEDGEQEVARYTFRAIRK